VDETDRGLSKKKTTLTTGLSNDTYQF